LVEPLNGKIDLLGRVVVDRTDPDAAAGFEDA
jgi:hypothetical protein